MASTDSEGGVSVEYKEIVEALKSILPEKCSFIYTMGAEKICTQSREFSYGSMEPYLIEQAADAITELLFRCTRLEEAREHANEACAKWEARAEHAERALARMWYAYANKDPECPHEYEQEAVSEAERVLGKWEDVMPGMMKEG